MTKVWLFLFADPTFLLASARVAAADRRVACVTMEAMLQQLDFILGLDGSKPRPAEKVVLSYMGRGEFTSPSVISCITRKGETLENPGAL